MTVRARPLGDRVVVKRDEAHDKTPGGIIIVQTSQKPQRSGEVMAVGDGAYSAQGVLIPMSLKVGDRILFGAYAGTEIEIDGDKYQIMREGDCACVIDEDAEVSTDGLTTPRAGAHPHYQ